MKHRLNDAFRVGVNVTIEVHDAQDGRLLSRQRRHNLVTLAGRNLIRDLLAGIVSSPLTHFGVGTGSTSVTANDVALVAQVHRDVVTKLSPDAGKLTVQFFLGSTSANGSTLREAGVFTAASGGTLFSRVVHDAIAKTQSITVTYNWEFTISAV